MKNHKIYLAGLACCLFACSGNGDEPEAWQPGVEEPATEKIQIALSVKQQEVSTRATDTEFEANDKVGIYVVNYQNGVPGTLQSAGNHIDNTQFSYIDREWKADAPIYWADKTTKADFYCYYPYDATVNVDNYTFAVKADQSSLENYKASDFLWGATKGVAPTTAAVDIITHHVMSNALVSVVRGKGFSDEEWANAELSVRLANVKTEASVQLSTGVATAQGTAGDLLPMKEEEFYRALVVPQTIAANTPLVVVTVNGTDYTMKTTGITFLANTKHKLSVEVKKVNGGIDVGIGGWETDDTDYGGIAE